MPLKPLVRSTPTKAVTGKKGKPAKDQVEVKLTIDAKDLAVLWRALGIDDKTGDIRRRTVTFFDTPQLDLQRAGISLRTRREYGDDDTTVKIRGGMANDVAIERRALDGFKLETDRSGSSTTVSASYTRNTSAKKIDSVIAGEHSPQILFTTPQEKLIEQVLGKAAPWRKLVALGPAEVTVWKKKDVAGLSESLVVERWRLQGGKEIVEVSSRTEEGDGRGLAAELAAFLKKSSVSVSEAGEMKTRATIAHYARQLDA